MSVNKYKCSIVGVFTLTLKKDRHCFFVFLFFFCILTLKVLK